MAFAFAIPHVWTNWGLEKRTRRNDDDDPAMSTPTQRYRYMIQKRERASRLWNAFCISFQAPPVSVESLTASIAQTSLQSVTVSSLTAECRTPIALLHMQKNRTKEENPHSPNPDVASSFPIPFPFPTILHHHDLPKCS